MRGVVRSCVDVSRAGDSLLDKVLKTPHCIQAFCSSIVSSCGGQTNPTGAFFLQNLFKGATLPIIWTKM